MKNCKFCEIATKSKKHPLFLARTEKFMAFLDTNPRTLGHSLVIPQAHYRWVDEVPEFGAYFEFARQVARAIRKALKPIWLQYLTIGEIIPHAHIHLIPRYNEPEVGKAAVYLGSQKREIGMKEIAEKIRKAYSPLPVSTT